MLKIRIRKFTKFSADSFLCVFVLLLFFLPAEYVMGNVLDTFCKLILCGVFLILLLFYVSGKQKRIKNTTVLLIFLLFWVNIGASFINEIQGNSISWKSAILSFMTSATYLAVCDLGLRRDPAGFLHKFVLVSTMMCLLNAVTMFVFGYSGGMNHETESFGRKLSQNYFLFAEDNASVFWTWPTLMVSWFYAYRYDHSRQFKIYLSVFTIVVTLAYAYMWSVMAVLACLSVVASLCAVKFFSRKKTDNNYDKKYAVACISGIAVQVLLSTQVILHLFLDIITDVFHKSVTISGRTLIWERAYYYIGKSLIVGYGYESPEKTISRLMINHTHNMFTETLYRGGIIAIVLFALVFLSIYRSSRYIRNKSYGFVLLQFAVFLILTSIEFAFYRYHFLILFVIMSDSSLFCDKIAAENTKGYDRIKPAHRR